MQDKTAPDGNELTVHLVRLRKSDHGTEGIPVSGIMYSIGNSGYQRENNKYQITNLKQNYKFPKPNLIWHKYSDAFSEILVLFCILSLNIGFYATGTNWMFADRKTAKFLMRLEDGNVKQ